MPISSDTIRLSSSDAQSVGAGASANSASVDGRASAGPYLVFGRINNGASAPTTNPSVDIEFSADGTTWSRVAGATGDQVANSVTGFLVQFNEALPLVRAVMRSGATNGSTFGVWLSRVVSL